MSLIVEGDWWCVCGCLVINDERCSHCGRRLLPPETKDDQEVQHETSYGFDMEDYG